MTFVASTCYHPLATQGMGTWLLQPKGYLSLRWNSSERESIDPGQVLRHPPAMKFTDEQAGGGVCDMSKKQAPGRAG